MIKIENQDAYKTGKIVHSSQLDELSDEDLVGKSVLVIGSGASGVESVELAVKRKAGDIKILARDDKVCLAVSSFLIRCLILILVDHPSQHCV